MHTVRGRETFRKRLPPPFRGRRLRSILSFPRSFLFHIFRAYRYETPFPSFSFLVFSFSFLASSTRYRPGVSRIHPVLRSRLNLYHEQRLRLVFERAFIKGKLHLSFIQPALFVSCLFSYVIKKRCYYRYPKPAGFRNRATLTRTIFGLVTRSSRSLRRRYVLGTGVCGRATILPFLPFLSSRD